MNGISAFIIGTPEALPLFLPQEDTVSLQAISGLSSELDPAGVLILDFQPLELWKINNYCL